MNTFIDNSRLEDVLNTLKWGKMMLSTLGDYTHSSVSLNRIYVRDDEVVFAFTIDKKKCSVTVPHINNFFDAIMEVRLAATSHESVQTDYQHFIRGFSITNQSLFN